MPGLEGKIAMVTGAGSGIGAAITRKLVRKGARVIAVDISGAETELAREIGAPVMPRNMDIADETSVRELEDWVRREYGRLDILANNAGINGTIESAHDYPTDAFDRIIEVNVRGHFLMLRAGLRLMIESGGGSIVNTASIGGLRATPNMIGYTASKGASVMMTRTAALEYADRNIRVNAVAPGAVDTPLLLSDNDDSVLQMLKGQIPQERLGRAGEIANVVAFLADDEEASHVTGQVWVVDGGRSAG